MNQPGLWECVGLHFIAMDFDENTISQDDLPPIPPEGFVFFESCLPRLVLIEQGPPPQMEQVPGTEEQRAVHVVVKNVPFNMKLGLQHDGLGPTLNLNHLMFEGKLLYSTKENKEVDYVSVKPVELRRFIKQEKDEIQLQLRIKVLSSHHENLCFVVKILALNPITGKEFHPLMTILSEPIRVISKPERKQPKPTAKKAAVPKKKIEERIKDSLKEIEEYQEQQQLIISQLRKTVETHPVLTGGPPAPTSGRDIIMNDQSTTSNNSQDLDISYNSFLLASPFGGNPQGTPSNNPPNSFDWLFGASQLNSSTNSAPTVDPNVAFFERSFKKFLFVYNTMTPDARHDQIRKFLRNSVQKDLEQIHEFIRILSETQIKNSSAPKSECACDVCPYQTRLQQIEFEQFAFPGMDESDSSMSFYPNWS